MLLLARYPRIAAWLVALALIGIWVAGGLLGLRALKPAVPAHLMHVHGVIVAVRADGTFALQVAGRQRVLWFRPAPGAPISLAHLRRHLHEHAATDVFYQAQMARMPFLGAIISGVRTGRSRRLPRPGVFEEAFPADALSGASPGAPLLVAWEAD
jgi:hypothetical protein